MQGKPRVYRKKPLAVFENGTRIYSPSSAEPRYRVVAQEADGSRAFAKFDDEDAARRHARRLDEKLARAGNLATATAPVTRGRARPSLPRESRRDVGPRSGTADVGSEVLDRSPRRRSAIAAVDAAAWHPHDLRHTAACWTLFDLRLDPALVALFLGHSNANFTRTRYVGVRGDPRQQLTDTTDRW